jgi:hypothetical protein
MSEKDQYFNVKSSGGGGVGFVDEYLVNIKAEDTTQAPSDNAEYEVALEQNDSVDTQAETIALKFPSGVYGEQLSLPTEALAFTIKVWLANSAGTEVTNPSNANGENDGSSAVVQTNAFSSNTERMTSDIGTSVGTLSFTTALYRGYFSATTPIGTSTASLIAHSTDASFSDITMFSLSTGGGSVNNLDGSFTYDLFAAGLDTLAKLQSLQIYHTCTDVAAGITPAVLTVDAGALELTISL